VFRAEGLPLDLAYIPLIESAFKPNALSRARAKGVWQFMRGTAIENGLRQDWYIDERSDPEKATVARALSVPFRAPTEAQGSADIVLHTSGAPAGLVTALELAGFEARVIEMSWYGTEQVTLPLGERFHSQRLSLRSSQVGAIAPAQRGRWTAERRMALVMRLLAEPVLDALITGESPFDELPAIMQRLADAPGATLCHRIGYR